ncbi:MAG: glycine cleavage system aminomethyltransferase GcvT [Holophagales bacterium]|jgi:aminomethyltransferase|nr:glycine cleavage system aminomethyltransferase GcvT [Holophagales bacterium]
MAELRKTPLNAIHRSLGAKMVDFGGWDMPVQYPTGIINEHQAVRQKVGLFDVSHMGEIRVTGKQSMPFLDWLTPNSVIKLNTGQIHYTGLLNESGAFVDDLLLHKISDENFLLVVNASNTEKDFDWIVNHARKWDVQVTNESDATGQVALQGSRSLNVLQPLVDIDLSQIKYYWFASGCFKGLPVLIARTGYTGEDGFEVYCAIDKTEWVWNQIMENGRSHELIPTGLGCRNTLRLEAKMALYGHEINDEITALEADLNWMVKLQKGDFIGREALQKQKNQGIKRVLAGFKMLEKRDIARDHMSVVEDGRRVGFVTSGAPSVTLGFNLGLAMVPVHMKEIGTQILIEIRNKACPAEIIPTPFYKRGY